MELRAQRFPLNRKSEARPRESMRGSVHSRSPDPSLETQARSTPGASLAFQPHPCGLISITVIASACGLAAAIG
jgi:hypothetical protein